MKDSNWKLEVFQQEKAKSSIARLTRSVVWANQILDFPPKTLIVFLGEILMFRFHHSTLIRHCMCYYSPGSPPIQCKL